MKKLGSIIVNHIIKYFNVGDIVEYVSDADDHDHIPKNKEFEITKIDKSRHWPSFVIEAVDSPFMETETCMIEHFKRIR